MELLQHIYQVKIPFSFPQKFEPPQSTSPFKSRKGNTIEQNPVSFHRLPHVNAYLIEGTEGNLLIDTGLNTPECYSSLSTDLKNYGFTLKDISQIVVTHFHPDHSGQAGKIKQFSGAIISVSKTEGEIIEHRYQRSDEYLASMLEDLIANGVPANELQTYHSVFAPTKELIVPFTPDNLLLPGDKITFDPFEFVVYETPGHSHGHVCLYEPRKKFLFTGDLILPEITTNIGYYPGQGPNPLADYFKSLEQIYDLEINFAFPGHGPAFSGVRQIIEALMRHHEERNRSIKQVLEGNTMSSFQVAVEIPWMFEKEGKQFQSMSLFDRRLAISETTSHLEYLLQQGEIGKSVENNINVYFA